MSAEIEIGQEGADAPLGFDASDRPPAGTECARCRKLYAHYCPAKGYAGEQALCLACGSGSRCEQTEARLRLERARGYDEMEVDARGLHGECRQIAIAEEERIAAPEAAVASSAWAATVKPTLSAANLVAAGRARREVVRARRRPGKRMEADREAGRRRRMAEVMSEAKAVEVGAPPVRLSTKEAKAKAFELRGTGLSGAKIAIIVGRAQPSVAKWFRDADAEMLLPGSKTSPKTAPKKAAAKKQAALARLEAAMPPLPGVLEVPGGDLISIQVPQAALDRLFALLPPAMKGAAMERLLAEMAKKGAA